MILHWLQHAHQSDQYLAVNEATECVISNVRAGAESISISIFICSKCPEIHIKGFSIASRTTRLRPALTAAQLIN